MQPPKRCLILTASLSSVKALLSRKILHQTHPLVYECKQMCSNQLWNGVEVEMMWIPSHVRLEGNELLDERARHAALIGAVFDRPFPSVDLQGWAKSVLEREWQNKWDAVDTVRFAHFILPKVSLRPWIEGKREDI
jgi:hypothetical protein